MSIRLYFGLPGSGKTTLLSRHALQYSKKRNFNVYSNVPLNIPRVIPIENDMIGKYRMYDGVILIDEATIFADSRNFKSFSSALVTLFCLHRHLHLDIELFLQNYNRTDLTIRMLADKVFWIRKFGGLTCSIEIPMSVFIPKKDVSDSSGQAGEIENGYYRPPLWSYIFCEKIWRKKYYPYFDSFDTSAFDNLPELPDELLRHNPDTCPQTNVNFQMDSEKVGALVFALQERWNLDLDPDNLDLPEPKEEPEPTARKKPSRAVKKAHSDT